jgi:hypothetical protein
MSTTRCVFHADLSNAHPDETYWLSASGNDHPLQVHDNRTRDQARAAAPHLQNVADAQLTHFTEQHVALPAASVIRVHLKHTMKTVANPKGEFGVHHVAIHVPPPAHLPAGAIHHHPIDWITTAKALVFHHPELISNDPDIARIVYEYMNNEVIHSQFVELAGLMKSLGPPAESGDTWAQLVPFTPPANEESRPPIDGKTTFYQHRPVPTVVDAAGHVMTMMLKYTKNDLRLKDKKWRQHQGTSVEQSTSSSHPKQFALGAAPDAAGTGTWKAALANKESVHGWKTKIEVKDPTKRSLTVKMENTFIRYLGAYIRFYDINGKAIPVPGWHPYGRDFGDEVTATMDVQYDDLRYLGLLESVENVFGVPIVSMPGELEVDLDFPANAVSASIYGSGLGTGSDEWPKSPAVGGVLTGLVNLTIPSFMLGFQVASQTNKGLYDIVKGLMKSKLFIGTVLGAAAAYIIGSSVAHKRMNWRAFTDLTKFLFERAASKMLVWVELQIVEQKALEAIPFAGWIIIALDIATGTAQLAQTIAEVSTSPWNIENKLATSITTTVVIHPDPRHKAWPQPPSKEHASYTVRMIYKGKTARPTREQHIAVPDDTTSATLSADFTDNTLGDQIKIEVDYFLGSWTAGRAATTWIDNNEIHATTIHLYLVQNPIPLDDKSIYAHTALLTYQGGNFKWMTTPTAPSGTIGQRNSGSGGNAIADWSGLTLSQRHAVLGMAWKAAGLVSCVNPGVTGQLYMIQSLNIPGAPMQDVRYSACGFESQSQIIADPYPPKFLMVDGEWKLGPDDKPVPDPADSDLGAFFIDPSNANGALELGGGYHLRRLELDGSGNFNFNLGNMTSWGRFQWFPDSFAVHPGGWVIGVSAQYGKIQVARLAEGADFDVPVARVYGGQALNDQRLGLLFHAVAVACAYDGTIFILEDAKQASDPADKRTVARIQTFDLYGNPVNRFFDEQGNPSPVLPLLHPDTYTYLDLAAVGNSEMTYLYVLYYQGDGFSPSDYHMALYQYGKTAPAKNPLTITDSVSAAKVFVDMWHTMYTLNYDTLTDGSGNIAGPPLGSGVRTIPSLSEWLPPLPKKNP